MREDCSQTQIFTIGFYVLMGVAVGSIVADNFAPKAWFWISFAAFLAAVAIGILRYKLRIFETIEASFYAGLSLLGFFFLYIWVTEKEYFSGFAVLFIITLLGLFELLDKHYKGFTWYKSGKVGFSGLSVAGFFFLIRALVALFAPNMLSFVGRFEVIISAALAFSAFFLVFNLSRQTA